MNFKQKMARLSAIALATGAGVSAHAAGTDPVSTLLGGIDLTAVAAAVLVIGALVVGITMSFKGVDVSKRAIKKV
ncbi:hypothetical protein RAE19_05205 [Rhodoferax sp. TBRC 17660]|uniref:Phage coat protein n=1 Tax=Rhodoferax potami TaxID=3068338 RepID=A0ABU3KKB1_9BURK|nr:hypothetical protein [Rhodoferax sp. TBRC 17660]MDT7518135.1 hypothetical protein [Rhodoferax sp. TBRC 17660]